MTLVSYLEDHLDEYLEDLRTLTAIDSGTAYREGVQQVVEWMQARMEALGFNVEREPQTQVGDNLIGRIEGKGSGHILLLGHTDTVFPTGTAAKRPLRAEGDKLLAPGVADMKAGLLTGLYAVKALKELGLDDFGQVTFLCVSDEEVEGRYSPPLIRKLAREADVGLTLEAARANGDIVVARKGVRVFIVEAFGHAAHAGVEPEKGRNAIVAMAHHILALNDLNGMHPDVTVNPGVITGGTVSNAVPDYARLEIDVRAYTVEHFDEVEAAIREQLAREVVPGVEVKIGRVGHGHEPMPYTEQAAAVEALAQNEARKLGFEVNGAHTGGASDASIMAAEGKPVLDGLGPIGGLDHSPDEYLLKSSIVPRTALLANLIRALSEQS